MKKVLKVKPLTLKDLEELMKECDERAAKLDKYLQDTKRDCHKEVSDSRCACCQTRDNYRTQEAPYVRKVSIDDLAKKCCISTDSLRDVCITTQDMQMSYIASLEYNIEQLKEETEELKRKLDFANQLNAELNNCIWSMIPKIQTRTENK